MKILITGGAGFIGSNLCRTLLAKDFEVFAADNLITGNKENLAPLLTNDKFHFDELDINSPEFLKKFRDIKVDQIYHLACPTGVPNIKIFGEEMLLTSSLGSFNVLELVKIHRAKLIFSSTAEVYGNPEVFPQTENYNGNVSPIGPRSAYEEGKRFSESLIVTYTQKYKLDTKIVRIFNTFGPFMHENDRRVIPTFIKQILNGKPITIYGDGNQTRTHLFIDDLISGLLLTMEKGGTGEAYNIGGRNQITINQLAKTLLEITDRTNGIEYISHFIEDHNHRRPSIEKVKQLGWQQKISLEEGLKKTIKSKLVKAEINPKTNQGAISALQVD
jgi:nucleoside-diphosphate-sugar epimerase